MAYVMKKKIKSDVTYVKNIVNEILIDLNGFLDNKQKFNTKLILSELLINGVRHGNKLDKSKYVHVNVLVNRETLKIQVSDEGKGFNYDKSKYNPYSLEESGRGLVIVEGLSDHLSIKGNTVTAIKYL